jgi:hypothetical protein
MDYRNSNHDMNTRAEVLPLMYAIPTSNFPATWHVTAALAALALAGVTRAEVLPISVVLVNTPGDGRAGVFQSHNQKVVSNAHGIFMTYIETTPTDTTPGTWRLARSTDGGQTFATVYQNTDFTAPPALETDENDHIYLTYPTYGVSMHFARFSSGNGYTAPDITRTYNGVNCAAKFAMAYDRQRQRFHIASQYGQLLTVNKQGDLLRNLQLFSASQGYSATAYPHLFVESAGTASVLHYAVTTADTKDGGNHIPYETIRYVKSSDGGLSWQSMGGAPITTPTTPEPNGPSTMINLADEITPWATWLSTMHVKGGKVHFAYHTGDPWDPAYFNNPGHIDRQHYMRFNGTSGAREIDTWPGTWTGTNITIRTTDGLLASDSHDPSGPLYMVGASTTGHLSALMSKDNGTTWLDYATSSLSIGLYAIGGSRELSVDGKVIGSFSGQASGGGAWETYYYAMPAIPSAVMRTFAWGGYAGVIDPVTRKITLHVPIGTPLAPLHPNPIFTMSYQATCGNRNSGGTGTYDFSNSPATPLDYTVISSDSAVTNHYGVTVIADLAHPLHHLGEHPCQRPGRRSGSRR